MSLQDIASVSISPAEAHELQKDPRTTFLDVRSTSNFAAQHIIGAINVPIHQLEDSIGLLSKERPIIIYCDMPPDERSISMHVVQLLRSRDYIAFAITGGLDAWKAAGFDVASSP